jgi:hypothetical protein
VAEATERAPEASTAPTHDPSTGGASTVDAATGGAAPADTARGATASSSRASDETPVDAATVEAASVDVTTADTATVDKAPADKAPADKAPADKAPADKAPVDKAPVDKASADTATVDAAAAVAGDRPGETGDPAPPSPATGEAPGTARARVAPGTPPAPRKPGAPRVPSTASVSPAGAVPATTSAPVARRTRAVGKAAVPAVAVPTVPNPRVPVDSAVPAAEEHTWLDEEAGPVVRPYTLTGGRSRPFTSGLNMLTYVEALYAPDADLVGLQPEQRAILEMTRTATTVVELAARLDLPVGVVRVLVGDLIQANLVSTFEADAAVRAPGDDILQAVIDGLRAL